MDLAEYKNFLGRVRREYRQIRWRRCHLQPMRDPLGELMGWKLLWAGTFDDPNFVRLKETWIGPDPAFEKRFFSYHYGPYHPEWDLETVTCKAVVVRLDSISYHGRGCHIHDCAKDKRIFQDTLKSPVLENLGIIGFLEALPEIRKGRTVAEAFALEFL